MFSAQIKVHSYLLFAFVGILALSSLYLSFSVQPAFADDSCPDDSYYMDGGNCIHKTGGTYSPGAPGADQISCVYAFIEEPDKSKCGGTNPNLVITQAPAAATPGITSKTTPAPSKPIQFPIPSGTPQAVTADKWSATAQSTYAWDNTLCSLAVMLAGFCPYTDLQPARVAMADGKVSLAMFSNTTGGGAFGTLASVTGSLYAPPTSTVQYLASIGQNFGFATPAYAQTLDVPGSGAGIIEPIRTLWQAIRNIAYLAFILIFIVVGFMVMFRQKISQQAVVTAQMALPGLVVGLILVTFSYFIAALIIDLSFVGIPLVTNVFGQTGLDNAYGRPDQLQKIAQDSSIFQLFGMTANRFTGNVSEIGGAVQNTLFASGTGANVGIGALFLGIIGIIAGTMLGGPPGAAIGATIGGASGSLFGAGMLTGVISLLLPIILLVALLFQLVRLLLNLIGTYIQLLVATLTGPLVILASSLPGRGGGISKWMMSLVANALVFPAVFAAFLFAGLILAMDQSSWQAAPPLFGGLSIRLLQVLLAYGVILATPGIPDAVRGAFGIKPQQGGLMGAATAGFMGGFAGAQMLRGAAQGGVQLGYHNALFDRPLRWARGVNVGGRRPLRGLPTPMNNP